jgi:uncharacterized cysteine cluster protein YcgN (CxxCxxCC family)
MESELNQQLRLVADGQILTKSFFEDACHRCGAVCLRRRADSEP